MLVAIPALRVLLVADLPLVRHRQQLFEAEMSLQDQRVVVPVAVVDFVLLVNPFRLHNVLQLEALSDVFPEHLIRLRRLMQDAGPLAPQLNQVPFHGLLFKLIIHELFVHLWNNDLWWLLNTVDALGNPCNGLRIDAQVATQMQNLQGLGFCEERG